MNKVLRHSQLFIKRNSSTILTCVGGVGVVATAVMAVKATPKALLLLDKAKKEKGAELTKVEKVQTAGLTYIPAVLVGVSTIACIFGANVLNKRQQAALMSAYALLDNSYKDYKKKVEELYGEDANERISEEIVKDKYEEEEKIEVEDNKQLFYDDYSGRYFESTMEDVLRAELEINKLLCVCGGAYLNEFYDALGIPPVDYGEHMGWSTFMMLETCWDAWLGFEHKKVTFDDGLECYIITMSYEPEFGFEDW
jgi:hypothetical protein